MNYYGTEAHDRRMRNLDVRIFSKIDFSEPDREKELENGYAVKYYDYADEENCRPGWAPEAGEICRLYHDGQMIFEWKNTDGMSRLANIIHHADGHEYFVFDEDLYGYSVLDLGSMNSMHYIPAESYAEPAQEMLETFLWCDCFYDPGTDLLAVDGCYWACPENVIVLDFSNPMEPVEAEDWTDVYSECSARNKGVGGIKFVRWENAKLICRVDNPAIDSLSINGRVEVGFIQ